MSGEYNKLEYQIEKLERTQKKLFELLSSLSEEEYYQPPAPQQWSVAQAANHVFQSEILSLSYLRKKISYPNTIPDFRVWSWGSVLALKFSFYSPIRFKAPAQINMWGDQPVASQVELMQQWPSLRRELFDFIRLHQPGFKSRLVYKHPIAGRLTLHQMLIFFNDHMNRHLKQIERIMHQIKK